MKKYKFLSIILVILFLLPLPTIASNPSVETQEVSAKIAGNILLNGKAMNYLQALTDRFGPRLTGTSVYNRSAEWAVEEFKALGLKNVHLEKFTTEGWERVSPARAKMIAPMEKTINIQSLGWTPSTPSGGISGEIAILQSFSPEKVKEQADGFKGKILLVDPNTAFPEGRFAALVRAQEVYAILKQKGALAVLIPDRYENNTIIARKAAIDNAITALPVAALGLEDNLLISRLLEKGSVKIEFQYENKTPGQIPVNNVIAEIPGREKSDEWILVGAHLDSWDFGTGAQDNGTGCASVLEVARAVSALNQAPRRTIRFALWGGEEQGLLGSKAYIEAHKAELGKCVAVLNTDNGAGHPIGWKVQGRNDLSEAMKPISNLLINLNGNTISPEVSFDTDHAFFVLEGIPALDLLVDMTHYDDIHHKASDTIDKVNPHNLAAGATIVAVTAYNIAEQPTAIAPRLQHDAIEEILKKANLYEFLVKIGEWK
jgi:hypothetical protein